MRELFEGVIKFREEDYLNHKELYENLKKKQNPHTLFITCVDSRIVPNLITNTLPGDLFVVRNVGNIVPPYKDGERQRSGYLATTSAIEYALSILDISNIIICGHSNCGACSALYENKESLSSTPYVQKWLELLNPVKERVEKLAPDSHARRIWLTEQSNIEYQLENLMTYPFVEEKFDAGILRVYGWYYIIERGEILNYNMIKREFKEIKSFRGDA